MGCAPLGDIARSRRIACLLFTVWILCMADLSFTLWAHWFTPFHELNPFARRLLEHNWITSLVTFKILLTCAGTGIFWFCRRRRTAELATWLVAVAYVMLACQWSNYTQAAMVELAREI
jgi:hypothetical protein